MGRHKSISLDDPMMKKAVEMYRSGSTVKDAAEAVYLSAEGLRYRFMVLGVSTRETRRGKLLPQEIVEKIRQERRAGKTYKQIRADYKVSNKTIAKYAWDITPIFEARGKKKFISLDDPDTQKAIELYQNGANCREAAAAIYITAAGLQNRFKVLGIPMREPGKKKLTNEQIAQIRREYQSGKSFCRIAKEMGITPPTIRKYAKIQEETI